MTVRAPLAWVDKRLLRLAPEQVGVLAAAGVLLTAFLDYLTGIELSFSIFYLVPVSTAAWYGGRSQGIGLSLAGGVAWLLSDHFSGHRYSAGWILYWNALVRLGFFTITVLLLSALRAKMGLEERVARTDSLTGAWNTRGFLELAEREIARTARYGHPFTLAYADLDHFKGINDAHGHAVGDQVLARVAHTLRSCLRQTDAVGRLGGDEFALLLPETDHGSAGPLLEEVRLRVREEAAARGWPVTLSIGAVTFERPPADVRAMTRLADELMYEVKRSGRDAVHHRRWGTGEAAGGERPDRTVRGKG